MRDAPCSHAILDSESRSVKARKIAALAGMENPARNMRMLEVGTGSGFIADYFSRLGFGADGTFAVDVNDERQVFGTYLFKRVDDTHLPFPDDNFDFIITNHVIEHVGALTEQRHHLSEIYRCLKPGGTLYFAVPNKWRLFEAHFRLPLLSWLPQSMADSYVKLARGATWYDCRPLSRSQTAKMLEEAGFSAMDRTMDAIRLVRRTEQSAIVKIGSIVPISVLSAARAIVPTLVFTGRKPA